MTDEHPRASPSGPPDDPGEVRLEKPNPGLLASYATALRTGWSPDNTQDVSARHLALIEADAAAFLARYEWSPGQTIELADGSVRPRLPGQMFWISDGSFCGFMSFRHQTGTEALPDHVFGHVGYGVVPWKRGQGIATQALRALLPVAREAGLRWVELTADPANLASQRVILSAGGVAAGWWQGSAPGEWLLFRIKTG